MAINVSQAFHRTSANPVDETMALTKAQMLTVNDNLMPSKYFTVCQDDGAIYLYDKTNTADPTTGKFRLLESGGKEVQVDTLPTASADELGNIYQYVGTTTADYTNGFFYECVSDGAVTPTYSWELKNVDDDEVVEISKADFDALPQAEKDNGKAYFIPDTDIMSNLTVAGFTPIGTVISVMGNTAPRHYLKCEGQVVNISDYPELATYFYDQFGSKNYFGGDGITTFGIPDLRGEFLRGTGTNSHSGQGNGADVGYHQNATEMSRAIATKASNGTPVLGIQAERDASPGETYNNFASPDYYKSRVGLVSVNATFASATDATVATFTTRPTNTSVLYCIATKNIYMSAENSYSTDEQVVGTWIDGKPLYQKTLNIDLTTKSTINTDRQWVVLQDLSSLNADELYIDGGFLHINDDSAPLTAFTQTTDDSYWLTRIWDKKIQILSSGNSWYKTSLGIRGYAIITIRYTKTTD